MMTLFFFRHISDNPTDFLTSAEKERIVKHELYLIRASLSDTIIEGLPDAHLYPDESISKNNAFTTILILFLLGDFRLKIEQQYFSLL